MKTASVHPTALHYLALSLASGVLETGVVTCFFRDGQVGVGLAAALAYQLGCLARNPLGMSLRVALGTACAGLLLSLISTDHIWALLLALAMVSAAIQSARDALLPKPAPVLAVKRAVRVSGFVAGILLGWYSGSQALVAIVAGCILPILLHGAIRCPPAALFALNRQWNPGRLGLVMLIHQIHYFTYCYVLLFHLLRRPVEYVAGSRWNAPLHAAIWFAVGWATYIGGERVLCHVMCFKPRTAAIMGHVWVVACLIGMIACLAHPWGLALCWALGGLGGGSVYAIKLLARESACPADLELWEHLGHVAGTGLAAIACLVWGESAGPIPCMIAICAAAVTLYGVWRLPDAEKAAGPGRCVTSAQKHQILL